MVLTSRPSNHVTRQLAERFKETGAPCPDLTETLLVWLEAAYPPQCYDPQRESLEQHLKYAGKVDLIASLRAQLEARLEGDEHLDPNLEPADWAGQ